MAHFLLPIFVSEDPLALPAIVLVLASLDGSISLLEKAGTVQMGIHSHKLAEEATRLTGIRLDDALWAWLFTLFEATKLHLLVRFVDHYAEAVGLELVRRAWNMLAPEKEPFVVAGLNSESLDESGLGDQLVWEELF